MRTAPRAIDSRIGAMVQITGEIKERAGMASADEAQVTATIADLRDNMMISQASAEQVRVNAAAVAETAANLDSVVAQMRTQDADPIAATDSAVSCLSMPAAAESI
jgi:hypothetical protein